tara:strand:+ start:1872 stop:2414 length:543 start_codon:yes stop_codon:yes gene_type:complete
MNYNRFHNDSYINSIRKVEKIINECNNLLTDFNYYKVNNTDQDIKNLLTKYEDKIKNLNKIIFEQEKNFKNINSVFLSNIIVFKNKLKEINLKINSKIDDLEKINYDLNLQIDDFEQQVEDLKNNCKCKICLENKIDAIIQPCMHAVACLSCLDNLTALNNLNCPICQKEISFYKKCYLV